MTYPVREFKVKYIGGHSQISKKRKVTIRLTQRILEIPEINVSVKYEHINYVNIIKEAALKKRGIFQYTDYLGIILFVLLYAGMMISVSRKKCFQISYRDQRGLEELLNFRSRNLTKVHAEILEYVVKGKQSTTSPTQPNTPAPEQTPYRKPTPTIHIKNENPKPPIPVNYHPQQSSPPSPATKKPIQGLEPGKNYSINEIKKHLSELSHLLATGEISKNEYARMSQPTFTAQDGKKWRIGKDTGNWYVFDGARWEFGDPSGTLRKN